LFGQRIYEGKETYYYEAVTDAELYSAGRTALLEAAEANPSLYKDVLREAGRRLQSNIQQLENIALKSAYYRLAHQLVYLVRQFGEAGGDGIALCIPLTHQDLADILSLSRETVSREMAKLREHGLVAADSELIIPDLARLQAVYS
jgi:CRP/FNR family transcriptional regulator